MLLVFSRALSRFPIDFQAIQLVSDCRHAAKLRGVIIFFECHDFYKIMFFVEVGYQLRIASDRIFDLK